ncbi:MAG: cbb3-type cytochrome c oxidase subunit I, partial [Parvularculaceae bacterium]|nr:cbb3-type cytochrome c oxidase subunit I [Parvularculaceae bacterium]
MTNTPSAGTPSPATGPSASTGGFDSTLIAAFLAIGSIFWIFVAARTTDPLMQAHSFVFLSAFILGGFALGWHLYGGGAKSDGYEMGVVKAGVFASMFWGIAGFLVGLIIALQLAYPNLLYFENLPWLNFGRLRPLHTSAVIFAFGGNVLMATSFYVVQRTCRARLYGGLAPWFVFWG